MARFSLEEHCEDCGLRRSRCICEQLPRLRLPWELVVVQHRTEIHKPSNTGRLLKRVVENCRLLPYAIRQNPLDVSLFREEGVRSLVLYPAEGAIELDATVLRELAQTATRLVFLDATWRQAGRMSKRIPGIQDLQAICLPPGEPSRWPIRRAHLTKQLSTLEAAVRLVQLMPELDAGQLLEEAFRLLVEAQVGSRPNGQPGRPSLDSVRARFAPRLNDLDRAD